MTEKVFHSMTDLILRGGSRHRSGKRDATRTADVAFADGRVKAVGPDLPGRGAEIVDAHGLLVVPGLIDLHTHVYWGGTSLGVDAADVARQSGNHDFCRCGECRPREFPWFSPTCDRAVAAPHHPLSQHLLSRHLRLQRQRDGRRNAPICGFFDSRECVRVIEANRDLIAGVKVRVGTLGGRRPPGSPPSTSRSRVAEETGLPVMAHLDHPAAEPPRSAVQAAPRRTSLTHCFRPFPERPGVRRWPHPGGSDRSAAGAGVIFDIGHGGGSFGFRTAEGMLASGFLPDVISSDVSRAQHQRAGLQPAGDDVEIPVLRDGAGRSDPGEHTRACGGARPVKISEGWKPGAVGDATLLELAEGQFDYRDVLGESRSGTVASQRPGA